MRLKSPGKAELEDKPIAFLSDAQAQNVLNRNQEYMRALREREEATPVVKKKQWPVGKLKNREAYEIAKSVFPKITRDQRREFLHGTRELWFDGNKLEVKTAGDG